MTRIITILTDGFADWETAILNGAAGGYYEIETSYASPGRRQVTSLGGMTVQPQRALEDIDVDAVDAVIVCGGAAWSKPDAPDLTGLLRSARAGGKVVGAICDGTIAAARTGILDEVAHTSNGAGYLDQTGYKGAAHYRDVPHAVSDQGIVTAGATAPVSFMQEIMAALGKSDANLDYYVGLHAAQFSKAA